MTRYTRGAALERECKAYLEDRGWLVVRSSGSHGPADVVAVGPGQPPCGGCTAQSCPPALLVQCRLRGSLGRTERETLMRIGHQRGAAVLIAARPRVTLTVLYCPLHAP